MIYMWKEERGKPYYRFQTDDKKTADKMKRRNKFKLVGYRIQHKSLDIPGNLHPS